MGLDTTHGAWSGSCSSFNQWRSEVARAAGLPPLKLMEGFYRSRGSSFPTLNGNSDLDKLLPIKWECLKLSRGLKVLLNHSDCEGTISAKDCGRIAVELEHLLPLIADELKADTQKFINGCRLAESKNEEMQFH